MIAALAAVAGIAGCGGQSGTTGVRVSVVWSGFEADQLEFSLVDDPPVAGAEPLIPPALRPEQAGAPLASGQEVFIYLKDDLDGHPVRCRVNALRAHVFQQGGESTGVTVRRGQLLACRIELKADPPGKHPPSANGAACSDDRQCDSVFCVGGVCCDSRCDGTCRACNLPSSPGICTFVPAGGKPVRASDCTDKGAAACSTDGMCDGKGSCELYAAGTSCADGHCDGSSIAAGKECDGKGSCQAGPAVLCAPFLCDAQSQPPRCFTRCTTGDQCVPGRTCDNASCGKKNDGAFCTADDQCANSHCAGGVCCDNACNGPCVSCQQPGFLGMCRPVAAGAPDPSNICKNSKATDPTSCGQSGVCDGKGACALYAADTVCRPASCVGPTLTRASACDGKGVCQSAGTMRCDPFGCKDGRCNATCAVNDDCAPGNSCDATKMSCGLKGTGQACKAAGECDSGFCVDGLCCSEACDGPCRSCSLATSPGICKNAAPGAADPRGMCKAVDVTTCGLDGRCDGNGACRRFAPGTVCAPRGCGGSTQALPSTCNNVGACIAGAMVNCRPYRCNGSSCFVSCGSDADCLAPNVCLGGACGLKPNGTTCALSNECASGSCTDGVCCESGSCGACKACNLTGSKGRCAAVPALAVDPHGACADTGASSCGTDGKCDGAGACHRYAAGTMCAAATCAGSTQSLPRTCNGSGTCLAAATQSCAPYQCGAGGACNTTCAVNGDCISPNVCAAGSCGPKPVGAGCGVGTECASGFCVDGVCCAQMACGSCQACNVAGKAGSCQPVPPGAADPRGMCTAAPASSCGQTGKCDGNGACQRYPVGTVCLNGSCNGNTPVGASTCNAAGVCAAPAAGASCAPSVCRAGACVASCASDADCVAPNHCVGTLCRRRAQGAACAGNDECDNGQCVDGVCCASASCGLCQACNVSGFLGSCANVGAGQPDLHGGCAVTPAAQCKQDGTCDGAGACRDYPADTVCAPATCMNKKLSRNPKTCDGQGSCVERGNVKCVGDCDSTTGTCP